ncbi:MAG TPA: hypothetical protein VF634_01480 [Pyrinomonadaceae bacterium]
MKRTPLVLNRLLIALALTTQLFLFAPATQAATNTNPSNTSATQHEGHDMTKRPARRDRCRERCQRQYRQCTRGVANPSQARCRQRYNQCLRRCRR